MQVDELKIPQGHYCYKNLGPLEDGTIGFNARICPYLIRKIKNNKCLYRCSILNVSLGDWGSDSFSDKIKVCGIKEEELDVAA